MRVICELRVPTLGTPLNVPVAGAVIDAGAVAVRRAVPVTSGDVP